MLVLYFILTFFFSIGWLQYDALRWRTRSFSNTFWMNDISKFHSAEMHNCLAYFSISFYPCPYSSITGLRQLQWSKLREHNSKRNCSMLLQFSRASVLSQRNEKKNMKFDKLVVSNKSRRRHWYRGRIFHLEFIFSSVLIQRFSNHSNCLQTTVGVALWLQKFSLSCTLALERRNIKFNLCLGYFQS